MEELKKRRTELSEELQILNEKRKNVINEIKKVNNDIDQIAPAENVMIEKIRTFCLDNTDYDVYDAVRDFIYDTEFRNWPTVLEDPEDLDSYREPIDLENMEVQDITEKQLDIYAGRDWQESMDIKIQYKNGSYVCVDAQPCKNFKGLSNKELASKLNLDLKKFNKCYYWK